MTEEFQTEVVEKLPKLRRYALSLTRDASDADDLVQDCIERSLSRENQFRKNTNLEAWLMSIMYSVFINGKRHERVVNEYVRHRQQTKQQFTRPSQLHHLELKQTLRAFRGLSNDHRKTLRLVGMQQHTHDYAARVMDTSPATVKTRLFRARARLREFLVA